MVSIEEIVDWGIDRIEDWGIGNLEGWVSIQPSGELEALPTLTELVLLMTEFAREWHNSAIGSWGTSPAVTTQKFADGTPKKCCWKGHHPCL